MSAIVGFAGSTSNPSRTRALVHLALGEVARRTGLSTTLFDLNDLGPSVGTARSIGDLSPAARGHLDRLRSARAIIIGSPVYKGSYPGLFKHVFDLLEPDALTGKPVRALCGKKWTPGRDPEKFPVCPTCKEIYESLQG